VGEFVIMARFERIEDLPAKRRTIAAGAGEVSLQMDAQAEAMARGRQHVIGLQRLVAFVVALILAGVVLVVGL
jgi:hypothetical protein